MLVLFEVAYTPPNLAPTSDLYDIIKNTQKTKINKIVKVRRVGVRTVHIPQSGKVSISDHLDD